MGCIGCIHLYYIQLSKAIASLAAAQIQLGRSAGGNCERNGVFPIFSCRDDTCYILFFQPIAPVIVKTDPIFHIRRRTVIHKIQGIAVAAYQIIGAVCYISLGTRIYLKNTFAICHRKPRVAGFFFKTPSGDHSITAYIFKAGKIHQCLIGRQIADAVEQIVQPHLSLTLCDHHIEANRYGVIRHRNRNHQLHPIAGVAVAVKRHCPSQHDPQAQVLLNNRAVCIIAIQVNAQLGIDIVFGFYIAAKQKGLSQRCIHSGAGGNMGLLRAVFLDIQGLLAAVINGGINGSLTTRHSPVNGIFFKSKVQGIIRFRFFHLEIVKICCRRRFLIEILWRMQSKLQIQLFLVSCGSQIIDLLHPLGLISADLTGALIITAGSTSVSLH